MASYAQSDRNIPQVWDIFAAKSDQSAKAPEASPSLCSIGHDSAISVSSISDDEMTATPSNHPQKKLYHGPRKAKDEPEVKYLERHLSMKKTIRKKIMRDLQKAFVEDPDEFRVEDIPPEQLKAELNSQSLIFNKSGVGKKCKSAGGGRRESNFLDFLRSGGSKSKEADQADEDSGHESQYTGDSETEDSEKRTSFWKIFSIKSSRNKR